MKVFFLITAFVSSALSLKITCNFSSEWFGYACTIKSLHSFKSEDYTVTEVIGQITTGHTFQDVKAIDGRQVTIPRFLLKMTDHFPNIETILFETGMNEIHRKELAQYPKLKKLYLSFNNIEVIEANLFSSNPNLELIFIGGNKIHTVYPKAFDGLTKLSYLRFNDNTCIDGFVDNNRGEVLNAIKNIYKQCAPSSAAGQCGSEIVMMKKDVLKFINEIRGWKKEIEGYMKIVKQSCDTE